MKSLPVVLALSLSLGATAGTVEGSVSIQSPLGRKPRGKLQRHSGSPGSALYQPKSRPSAPRDEVRNVVVWLADTPGGNSRARSVTLAQKDRQFDPYVLPVTVGSTVSFPNRDSIYHSVYSQSEAREFHLPEYAQGQTREVTFPKPGVVELFCAIHPEMNAYVLVLETGHFAMPGEDHEFRLPDVPAGKRLLKAWHPRLAPVTRLIEVPASGTIRVDLQL